MNLSFWERNTWFSNVDYTIVGSGIVGLNAALRLRQRFPESKILVLEKAHCHKAQALRTLDLLASEVCRKLSMI